MKALVLTVVVITISIEVVAQTLPPAPASFKAAMNLVYKKYLDVENALAAGNPALAKTKAYTLLSAAKAVKTTGIRYSMINDFNKNMLLITANSNLMLKNTRMESLLKQFELITEGLYPILKDFQVSSQPVYYNFCSSANNYAGGHWLSSTAALNNPYIRNDITGCEKLVEKF